MKLDTSLPPLHCTQAAHSLKLLDFRNSPEKPDRLEPAELSARQWRKSDPVMPQRHKSFCGLHWLHGFTCLLLAESLLAHVCCPRFLHPKSLDSLEIRGSNVRFFHVHFHGTHVGQTRLQHSTIYRVQQPYSFNLQQVLENDWCSRHGLA